MTFLKHYFLKTLEKYPVKRYNVIVKIMKRRNYYALDT